MRQETIVALSTPVGISGIAVVRASGRESWAITEKFLSKKLEDRQAVYALFQEKKQIIDDVVATAFLNPNSYTGEDMVEISCHGNPLIVDKIIRLLCQEGMRTAEPGEFTERAFLNGKMDLAQAESVMDLIHAQSERALQAARTIKEGKLGQSLEEKRGDLINLLAHLEAYIDFPEEDISPEVGEAFQRSMKNLREFLQQLIGTADFGELLREGIKVAIIGAPNVGKSSLLNALLEKDRAIVSELPGTTRDTIEETMLLEGIVVRFIDTAGIREKADQIEQLGIERTYQTISRADIVLYCIDGSDPQEILTEEKLDEIKSKVLIRCVTKSDLKSAYSGVGIHLSSQTRQGLDELKQTLIEKLKLNEFASQDVVVVNRRHEKALREAVECLNRAGEAYSNQAPPEIVSSDLRQAMRFLGEVVGKIDNEDILDQLFKSFCIGK